MKKTILLLLLTLATTGAWGFRYHIEGNVGTKRPPCRLTALLAAAGGAASASAAVSAGWL